MIISKTLSVSPIPCAETGFRIIKRTGGLNKRLGAGGMTKERVVAEAAALTAAIFWVSIALLVALPTEMFNVDIRGAADAFFKEFHFAFLVLLLLADIFIGVALLKDEIMYDAVVAGLNYVIFTLIGGIIVMLLYYYKDEFSSQRAAFWLYLFLITVIRFISYRRFRVANVLAVDQVPLDR